MAQWMAFDVGDYVSNTMHLTTRQHGGYILLICAAWNGKGFLPGTDAGLMMITKLQPKEWKDDGPVLKNFLTRRGDAWVHERVEFEWKDACALIGAKSKAGKKGARKRWEGRANGKPMADAWQTHAPANGTVMADPMPTQWQIDAPLPLPEPTVTTNHTEAAKTALSRDDDLAVPLALDRAPEAEALRLWNAAAERIGLPVAQRLTDPRRKCLKARLSESGGLDGWAAALAKVEASSFLTGKTGRGNGHENWRCDLDFILRQAKFTKLMEGGFDDAPASKTNLTSNLETLAALGERLAREGH